MPEMERYCLVLQCIIVILQNLWRLWPGCLARGITITTITEALVVATGDKDQGGLEGNRGG